MAGCSTPEDDPIERYFEEINPTLNFDGGFPFLQPETGHEGTVNGDVGQEVGADWDLNTVNNILRENNVLDLDWDPTEVLTFGDEGENSENVGGGLGNEVETNVAVPVSVWPPVLTPFNCSYCHVLREIIHENGAVSVKLEIHGRIGVICHAIQEKRTRVVEGPPIVNHEMVDFTTHSMESVKQFLTQYCQNRAREGLVLWEDPLSVYYNALCSGLNWLKNSDDSVEPNLPPENAETHNTHAEEASQVPATNHTQEEEANRTPENTNEARGPRTDLASQREKVKRLTLGDLTKCFHLRVVDAAKQLKICSTVLKKKSRTFGIKRWPNRQIKSRTKRISRLESSLREGNGNRNASSQIVALRRELAEIYTSNGMMMMAQD